MTVNQSSVVDDVMRRWPGTIGVFLAHRMHCVGCPIACFHTVADACREHGVERASFLTDLEEAIARSEPARCAAEAGPGQAYAGVSGVSPPSASTNSRWG